MSPKIPYILRRPDLDTVYQFKCTVVYVVVFFATLFALDALL